MLIRQLEIYPTCSFFLILLNLAATGSSQDVIQGNELLNKTDITIQPTNERITDNGKNDEQTIWAMVASLGGNGEMNAVQHSKFEDSSKLREALNFDWHIELDHNGRYQLDWAVNYNANEIMFALNINQTASHFHRGSDIFALGFSERGQLASSDFCIIWYDLGHRIHLQDARTDARGKLELVNELQGACKLLKDSGESRRDANPYEDSNVQRDGEIENSILEGADSIEIIFKRPLEVCNSKRPYYTIDNGTTHLVWFTLKGPLLSIDGLDLSELEKSSHVDSSETRRRELLSTKRDINSSGRFESGFKRVQLIANKVSNVADAAIKSASPEALNLHRSERHLSLDIRMSNYEIPAKETTYWCKLLKLPHKFESQRYHITRYEAIIEKGNEHIVHHMELFNCANLDAGQARNLRDLYESGGWQGDCGGSLRPKATDPCRRVISAWAMGAHPLDYPDQVGQSIGGHSYSPYVVLEVHYNNIHKTQGLVDNSGLRFHYTNKLRPYDAGILEVGLEYTDKNSIPPGLIAPMAGHCVGECTRAAMSASQMAPAGEAGQEGIYIFAAQMHTHLTGVASWTEHVREGKLLNELQRDDHYSPHFQEIRLLPQLVHLAPGDSLIHYCLYDTRERVNITLGGFATSDEMCVTYLHYYPRIDLEVCKSSVDTSALEEYFAYLAREEGQQTSEKLRELNPDSGEAKSVGENYHSIDWSPRRSRELLKFYANAPLSVQCNRSDGHRFPGFWNGAMSGSNGGLWSAPNKLALAGESAGEPFEPERHPSGRELVEYRGLGFRSKQTRCSSRTGGDKL